MANEFEVKQGDYVEVIVKVWGENEKPSIKNFYSGKVAEVIERAANCFYVKLENFDRLIPIDRVIG